jgi:brefeldin A-inhibited guanine nucleotide-exchange protein
VLKPFETIFTQTDSEVKEFILSCINHIVLNNYSNIRSGWKVIFGLINLGLKEEEERVYKISFSILSRIIEHNLDLI